MEKIIPLISGLGLALFLFTACTNQQPYNQYIHSYQQLMEADSFVVQKSDSLTTSENVAGTVDEKNCGIEQTYRVVRDDAEYMAIANVTMNTEDKASIMLNAYFRDGYEYGQNMTNPDANYRCQRDADFARQIAIEGVIDFPENIIAKQSEEDTDDGHLLTFIFDSEKYYEYRYPETSEEYSYGEFSSYREPPVYTVLLDQQGRIKQVTGHFCEVNSDSSAFTQDQSYTITFTQYGGVELDFPELNDADYPDMDAVSEDE